jgi:hypothetical protein
VVALHEGAAARVLAGEPDRHALHQQRAERQGLAHRPVDRAVATICARFCSCGSTRGCGGEALGQVDVHLDDALDHVVGHPGRDRHGGTAPRCRSGRRRVALAGVLGLGEGLLQLRLVVLQRCLGLFDGDVAAADQASV